MVITEDNLQAELPEIDANNPDQPTEVGPTRKPSRGRRSGVVAIGAGILIVAGIGVVTAAVQTTGSAGEEDQRRSASNFDEHLVIGSGPHAVYVGPAPVFGGDPARGETDESYFARTGRHLPGLSSAMLVEGPWWYGPPPVFGGDPASGETDDSYYVRTGRHLPSQFSTRDEYTRDLVARGLVPAATLEDGSEVTG